MTKINKMQSFKNLRFVFLVFAIVILWVGSVVSQCPTTGCTTQGSGNPSGGPYLPTSGTNKALVVFVKFSDDTFNNEITSDPTQEWPDTLTTLPAWASSFIDNSASGSHTEGSITDYFCKMSRDKDDGDHGKFHLIGDLYPDLYVPDSSGSWYKNLNNHGENDALIPVHKEIIQHIDSDPQDIDLDSYDLYTNGTTTTDADGIFDMIIIIYRFHLAKYSGESTLRGGSYSGITLGGLSINSGFNSGSGIHGSAITLDNAIQLMAHEYGHRLFGGGHHTYVGFFGVMDGCDGSGSMSAYERETLDWIDPTEIDGDTLNLRLTEAITTSDIYKIAITANEYFLLENRQRVFYTDAFEGDGDNTDYVLPGTGLMISHIDRNASAEILFERADGSDPTDICGGKSSDPFKPGNKIQFTQWTKPNSDKRSGNNTSIAITNIRQDSLDIIVDIYQDFSSGTITENSWWEGSESITGDITVSAGDTLTVAEAANISFSSGAELKLNGDLQAVGTSSNQITFTRSGGSGTWDGIRFYSGSSGDIDYATINYATKGVYVASTNNVTVDNSTIKNFTEQGVYLTSSDATIKNSTIKLPNSASHGIYILGGTSDPTISGNTIDDPTIGIEQKDSPGAATIKR